MDMIWYFIVLTCTSLITSEVQCHASTCLPSGFPLSLYLGEVLLALQVSAQVHFPWEALPDCSLLTVFPVSVLFS